MNREEFDRFSMQVVSHTYPGHENMTHQWWCQQNPEEFWSMISRLNNPKRILEIGSAHGGNLCFFDQLVGPDGLVVAVDIDPDAFSILDKQWSGYKHISTIKTYAGKSSTDPQVLIAIKQLLNGELFDFLFIDGDHTHEGAKKDFEIFSPLVKSGGIIAFHDVAIEPGCKQAWEECAGQKELLPVHYMGIGLVYV